METNLKNGNMTFLRAYINSRSGFPSELPFYKWIALAARLYLLGCAAILFTTVTAQSALALSSPTITPSGGSFINQQTVSMAATAGSIFYTTDGSTPTTSSTPYSVPFVVSAPTQVNAVAWQSGTYSPVTTAYLDIDPNIAPLQPNGTITFTISGTINQYDVVSVSVYDNNIAAGSGQPAGTRTYSYTVGSGDSFSNIADHLYTQFHADTKVTNAGITANWSTGNPYFTMTSTSKAPTTYLQGVSPPGNEVITQSGGLTMRLAATLGVAIGADTPNGVTSWTDLSGNGNNASSTAANRPTLLSFARNNLPVINFNGASQYLSLVSGFANFSNGVTLFVVTQPTAITSGARMIDIADGASGDNILFQVSSSGSYGQFWTYNGTSGGSTQSSSSLTSSQYVLLEGMQSGNTGTFYLNGTAGTTNTGMPTIPNTVRSTNFIGQASTSGNYYSGNIAEILLYSTQLSTSQRTAVEAYLVQRYALMSVVPPAPIISVPSGTLSGPTQVTISAEPGTTTHITTDGSTPTSSSPVYNSCPINITYSKTLKAVSIRDGLPSSVATATYTLNSAQWPAPNPGDVSAPTINLQLPGPTH